MNVQWVFWVLAVLIVLIGSGLSIWLAGEVFDEGHESRAGGCFAAVGVLASLLWAAVFVAGGLTWEMLR